MSAHPELPFPPAPPAETWSPPKAKGGCRRNPDAGEGTCFYWWEGCPKAEKRGCYQVWLARKFVRETGDEKARSFLRRMGLEP